MKGCSTMTRGRPQPRAKAATKRPRRLWAVIDTDPTSASDPLTEVYTSRKDARRACEALNGIPAYEPTCFVVGPYVLQEKP